MSKFKNSVLGLTLIELILSIALIGIIIISFMPFFIMSAKTNNKSETTLSSTYLGKDAMELAYELSEKTPYNKIGEELNNRGYKKIAFPNIYGYEYSDKRFLTIKFEGEENLVRVTVKIYEDESMNKLEVQYETLYSWVGRGILSE